MSLQGFAAEDYRHQIRIKTSEAMRAKAARGHVAGGKVFGYTNVRDGGAVRRVVNEPEAAVVRRIFELCASGLGFPRIKNQLNAERDVAPQPRRDRVPGWAASSVREVLYRPAYAGRTTYGKTRWRDKGGTKVKVDLPEAEWLVVDQPELRIVPEALWRAVHARLGATREQYVRWTNGKLFGKPAAGIHSDYLLVGLATCGVCGGAMTAKTKGRAMMIISKDGTVKRHSQGRATYRCLPNLTRGRSVCGNTFIADLAEAETEVRQMFSSILRPDMVLEILNGAMQRLRPSVETQAARRDSLVSDLAQVEAQAAKLAEAVALGGPVNALVGAIRDREQRREQLRAELAELEQLDRLSTLDTAELSRNLAQLLDEWLGWIGGRPQQARQIVQKFVAGRLTFTPTVRAGRPSMSSRGLARSSRSWRAPFRRKREIVFPV